MIGKYGRDTIFGALLAGFFLLFLFVVIPVGIPVPAGVRSTALSPAFWPRIVSVLMVVFGLMLMAQGILAARARPAEDAGSAIPTEEEDLVPPMVARTRIAAAMVMMFAYYGLVEMAGMTAASIIAFVGFAALYGERRWLLLGVVGVSLALALTLFFTDVAQVPIPSGTLWD
ncbi:tripartite tricarboxylate transporter TctB family protein [Azospirillum sp. RWY-5-1]|uniref:Tripartite tricarboxylate transporter TctB family protein n=1 Tax=Azospirillum oleiclasticum TaxID=2735135 RepID=A0ABX2T948_9PROT|nr:tripartite tricarboxylate transporter TctB family protein [Azospirillum oleiclasticum]NYZ13922.1 tripartite tricarboxylate transporter TctB family protein [Azospirillum oleiclasticum]NYZ20846.1 tripartite tricarboxylate transporter TctB family protein [Azospirillum oleiclasticum]